MLSKSSMLLKSLAQTASTAIVQQRGFHAAAIMAFKASKALANEFESAPRERRSYNNDNSRGGDRKYNNDNRGERSYGGDRKYNNDNRGERSYGGERNNRSYGGDRGGDRSYGGDKNKSYGGDRGGNRSFGGRNDRGPRRNTRDRPASSQDASNDYYASRDVNRYKGKIQENPSDFETRSDLTGLTWEDLVDSSAPEAPKASFSKVRWSDAASHKVIPTILSRSLIENRKYEHLTEVQAKTLIPILKGNNMIVKAKTGTGKTIAFGIPTIVKALELKRQGVTGIKSIVITPTRELAQQIVDEFSQTCSYGSLSNIRVGMAVGGLSMNQQFRTCFSRGGCDILVATPGRLLAFLRDSEEARSALKNLNFKTLDEADRLLDIGFGRDLDAIDTILKEQGAKFQTLLFSATIDEGVTSFAKRELGEDYEVVDTVDPNEPQAQDLVQQNFIGVNDWSEMYPGLVQTINKEVMSAKENNEEMKAIIFLPSVALTEHADAFLRSALSSTVPDVPVMCIHGRLTQGQRQRVADRFKKSQSAILTTTDVIARGMDFPNVTHVFQFGIPGELPSYVHRIGRTARIGNKGKSFVILSKAETPFLKVLKREYNVEAVIEPLGPVDAEFYESLRAINNVMDPELNSAVLRSVSGAFPPCAKLMNVKVGTCYEIVLKKFWEFIGNGDRMPSLGMNSASWYDKGPRNRGFAYRGKPSGGYNGGNNRGGFGGDRKPRY